MSGQGNKYKDSVNLPLTPFAMRGDLAKREPEMLASWDNTDLYGRIQAARKSAPPFILHDGPPYSNGHIHYGHILNKLLKDIVIKSATMAGRRTPYVPGWDTHGLPIELAVERDLGPKRAELSAGEFRRACRAYALKFVDIQRQEFKRLGVFGDWSHPYLTLDPSYEAAIVRALAAFTAGGYLYRGKKPVYWCTHDRTALAEAEIEYKDKTSPSIYVRMPVPDKELHGKRLAFVIWTTTPWTLPANLAIVAQPTFAYVLLPNPHDPGENLLVARDLLDSFAAAIGGADTAAAIPLSADEVRGLEGARYQHPFLAVADATVDREAAFRLWFADYVTTEQGTGLVHTAPGHGADDYRTGVAHGLPAYAPIDDAGRYVAGVMLGDRSLAGMSTDEANPIIVAYLAEHGFLLNKVGDKVHHSFPHCWRCKNPILFRATPQWFLKIDHDELRERALAGIEATTWVPPWGENRIHAMIENRPDWVLSRQRLWGTPIPTFYCTGCATPHAEARTMEHVAKIFETQGADAWWDLPVEQLVPAGTKCAECGAGPDKLEREKDIVDVWFESGVSWLAMQGRPDGADYKDIDLYLEGSDQHRGWFHSSLLTGVGVAGKPPYKQVITHGFVLDENGVPYSKSTIEKARAAGKKTSYIEPDSVIGKSGAELFRLWVASIEFRNDMPYSQAILDGLSEWYRKLRNTARFLLGNLHDFNPDVHNRETASLLGIDKYLLVKLDDVVARARAAYAAYELHVVHRLLVDFVTVDVSALYSDVVKDRLYSDAAGSRQRRGAQVVLYECLRAIATLAAPILCFTAEDIWQHMPKRAGDPDSVHLALFPDGKAAADDDPILTAYGVLLGVRDRVNKALEPFRAEKRKSTDARVTLTFADGDRARAVPPQYRAELADLFIVSEVVIKAGPTEGATEPLIEIAAHDGPACARCWKHYDHLADEPNDVCERCAAALPGVKA